MRLLYGNCLRKMSQVKDKSIDMVLVDPPYGATDCKWDNIIPLKPMWKQLQRIIKPKSAIVITSSQPFTTILIVSNIKMFKYCWVWKKRKPGNFQLAKNQPLKITEDILIFGKGKINYYPIPRTLPKSTIARRKYKLDGKVKNLRHMSSGKYTYQNNMEDGFGYPFNIIEIGQEAKSFHATQKPVLLMEYLIKTYTKEKETVLDFAMGSGTTGVACKRLNRDFIGIELNKEIFKTAKQRIKEAKIERTETIHPPNVFDIYLTKRKIKRRGR